MRGTQIPYRCKIQSAKLNVDPDHLMFFPGIFWEASSILYILFLEFSNDILNLSLRKMFSIEMREDQV
jgi:hypothetical protein